MIAVDGILGFPSLCKREGGMHDRLDPAAFQQRQHFAAQLVSNLAFFQDRACAQGGAGDGAAFHHQGRKVDLGL